MEFLKKGWTIFKRRWPVLLGCIAFALVGVNLYSATQHQTYTASTELFLRAPDVKSSASAYQGDLFSRQRVQTYVKMFHSDELAQRVIDKLGLTVTPQQLISQVHASTVKDTVLMVVSATDSNAQRAANIANGYGAVLDRYVATLENIENNPDIPPLVQVVTTANAATAEASGYPMWVILSIGLGAAVVLAVCAIWLLEHFDTKVRSRRQVEALTGSRVIGKFPRTRALGAEGSVAAAFDKSKEFAQAALRLSVNVESVLQRLPKVVIPPVLAVVASHSADGSSMVARSLARALVERARTVGLVSVDPESAPADEAQLVLVSADVGADRANMLKARSSIASANVGHGRVEATVEQLRDDCDIIVLDSPPFSDSVDAQVVIGLSDAVLLVVRPAATKTNSLAELASAMEILDTPVVGVVVNLAKESATIDGYYL